MVILSYLAAFAVGVILLLALWRFAYIRTRGTFALVRALPAAPGRAWRHGVVRYRGEVLEFYKLRSLSPAPDLLINRSHTAVKGHRSADEQEQMIMSGDDVIVTLSSDETRHEFALSPHAARAAVAWVEAAPDIRRERTDHKELLMKADRTRGRS